ncbi:MAG: hypothetical protein HY397_03120 [Candidatus Doudnabacteria bacterium]|nr:hypothetical protein [Candidatus Doudnabacteria bacterium]
MRFNRSYVVKLGATLKKLLGFFSDKKILAALLLVVVVVLLVPYFTDAFILNTGGSTPPPGTPDATASGGKIRLWVFSWFSGIFIIIRSVMYAFYYFVIMPFIQAAAAIQVGVGVCGADGVGTGFLTNICGAWQFVRNIVNMIFILMMIVIAVATILRIGSYNYKKTLGILLIMAMLVNFSLVIGQAILKVADILQGAMFSLTDRRDLNDLGWNLIAYGFPTVSGSNIFEAVMNWVDTKTSEVLVMELFNFMRSLLAFVVMGAIAAFLLIRLVVLWILLALSPLAYALFVLPSFAGLAKLWWSTFLKYAFFTPIMFFFIKIAVIVSRNTDIVGNTSCDLWNLNSLLTCNDNSGLSTFLASNVHHFLAVAFLLAALVAAKKLAIFGSAFLMGLGEKGLLLPLVGAAALGGAAAGAAAGLGGRVYSSRLAKAARAAEGKKQFGKAALLSGLQFLNPRIAKEAWTARQKKKEVEAYLPAAGDARDFLNRYMPTEWRRDKRGNLELGQKTKYGRIGRKGVINYTKKEWADAQLSEEEKSAAYHGATSAQDKEALRQLLIEGRHEDGLRIIGALEKQTKREEALFRELLGTGESEDVARVKAKQQVQQEIKSGKLPEAKYDAVADWMEETDMYKSMGLTSEQIGDIGSAQEEQAEAEKKIRALGQGKDVNGVFYSTADPEYYRAYQAAHGRTEMLQHVRQLMGAQVDEKDIDMSALTDTAGNKLKDANGQEIKVPVKIRWQIRDENGQETGKFHEITDFDSLQQAMDKTSLQKGTAYASGNNLRYELAGSLKQVSAQKRLDRGDTEQWGGAFEPAAFMEQDEEGNFARFTSYGKRLIKGISAAQVNSFRQSRRMQSRALKIGGLYTDKETGVTGLKKPEILMQLLQMNKDLAVAVLEKADFSDIEADRVAAELNRQFKTTEYRRSDKASARGGWSVTNAPKREKQPED